MPIEFSCHCGCNFTVPEQHVGKKGRCPKCGALILVPRESQFVAQASAQEPASATPVSLPTARLVEDDYPPTILPSEDSPSEFFCPGCGQMLRLPVTTARASLACPLCGVQLHLEDGAIFIEGAAQADETRLWNLVLPDGQQYGPADESEVIMWITEGRIGADTLVWRTGMMDWAPIESTPPFSRHFLGGVPLAPATSGPPALPPSALHATGPIIVDRLPMWRRPVSATVGRMQAPFYVIALGSFAFLKPGPSRRARCISEIAEGFTEANRGDRLEIQLGSSRPLRNLRRIWTRKGLSPLGKLLGILSWPAKELSVALMRSDHYDPFAHTVVLFHNDVAILAHEMGHARDFARRSWPLVYILLRYIPFIMLYQEWVASFFGIAVLKEQRLFHHIRRANRVLGGGFGTYAGGQILGLLSGPLGQFFGFIVMPFGRPEPQAKHLPP